jgi:hypothetical protein
MPVIAHSIPDSSRVSRTAAPARLPSRGVVRLHEIEKETGHTEVEVEIELLHLIIETKPGWSLPSYDQLQQYGRAPQVQ